MDTDPLRALELIVQHKPDVVYLDIDMPRLDGLQLALSIQQRCPGIIIIFVTAHPQYALDAYKAHPLDFLLKPVRQTKLDDCMAYLRRQYALLHPEVPVERAFVFRCFGPFEIACDMEIKWGTRRVKELLLYLIGRNGSPASKAELLRALFGGQDDKNTVHNLHMTVYRLKSLLDTLDPEHKFIRLTEDNTLITAPGVCDFTDFMRFVRENAVITEQNASEAERILALCRGPYLEKEVFDWISENADEVETEFERIALGLGSFYFSAGRLLEAERILSELVRRNALCGEGYALLLDIAIKSGNRACYLMRYEQYARILKKELRLKPAAGYREHYERLKTK